MDIVGYFSQPVILWFTVGFIFLMLEFFIPGLIIGFFGAGAWVTAVICSIIDINLGAQLLIFLIASILSVVLLRKKLKDKFFSDDLREEKLDDEFIGKKTVALTDIGAHTGGKVSLKGTEWEAAADVDIKKGTSVEIIGRDNLLLIVKPI
jgi:membrane protein implicated in regulation of membrane protease activity